MKIHQPPCELCSNHGVKTSAVGLWNYCDSAGHNGMHFLCVKHEKGNDINHLFAWRVCDLMK